MKKLLIVLITIALSKNLSAAGFDCNLASTEIEKKICTNTTLSSLDSELTIQYTTLLGESNNPQQFKIEQRQWLKNTRNKCIDVNCLIDVYNLRIQQLYFISKTLDNDTAKKICNEILSQFNNGTIENNFEALQPSTLDEKTAYSKSNNFSYLNGTFNIDINGENKKLSSINTAGTCGSGYIFDSENQTQETDLYNDQNDENLRWAHWGYYDSLMLMQDQAILITGNFFNKNSITLASWLDNKGKRHPLCSFSAKKETQVSIINSKNDNLCNKVKSQSILNFIVQNPSNKIKSDAPPEGGLGVPRIKTSALDLDNDGKQDLIGIYEYDSSSGCGAFVQRLRELNQDTLDAEMSDLNNQLERGMFQFASWGPILGTTPESWWHSVQLFNYENKAYLLAAKEGSNAAVYSFWGNEKKEWCDFQVIPQHVITTYYEVEIKEEKMPAGKDFKFQQ